jgi:AcrR family transcriptional regulator
VTTAERRAESADTGRIISERRRRTKTKTGLVLSRDLIADTAMRLIGEHGGEALSVRRLGAALGASPTAIYRYYATMDDLLLELADRLIGIGIEGFEPGSDWQRDLIELAHRGRRAYLDHPRLALLVASRVTGRANEARVIELILSILYRAGFDGDLAVRHYRTYGDMMLAFAAADSGFLALPEELRNADRARWAANHANVDPKTHPHMSRLTAQLIANADLESFESAVELYVAALAASAPGGGAQERA